MMKTSDGQTILADGARDSGAFRGARYPVWSDTAPEVNYKCKEIRNTYNVVIVGAGIVGVTLAYRLRHLGERVLLIEARDVLSGVTGHTTGKITAQHNLIYSKLNNAFNLETARAYYEGQKWAMEFTKEMVATHKIDCDLKSDDAVVYVTRPDHVRSLEQELEIYALLGIDGILDTPIDFPRHAIRILRMKDQLRFNPIAFLDHLLQLATDAGVHVVSHNRVQDLISDDGVWNLSTECGPIIAGKVIIATHYPIHDSLKFAPKLEPRRSYASAFETNGMVRGEMAISHEEEEFRSWRMGEYQGKPMLIVGSGHHRVGETSPEGDVYAEMESWARSHFALGQCLATWSTQDNWTPDHMPYIGRMPGEENMFVAAGFGGWGMSNGFLAAHVIDDLIHEVPNKWMKIFDPSRFTLETVKGAISEGVANVTHWIGGKIAAYPDFEDITINPGDGVLAMMEGKLKAIFRDEDGSLTVLDPACTHLGCNVSWNKLEGSWDCPCHGSRFCSTGAVLHGPATKSLEIST